MQRVLLFLDNFVERQFTKTSLKSNFIIFGIIISFFYLHFFNLVPFFPINNDHIYTIEFLDSGQRINISDPYLHHLLRWGQYLILYFLSLLTGGFSLELITITSGVSFFIAIITFSKKLPNLEQLAECGQKL